MRATILLLILGSLALISTASGSVGVLSETWHWSPDRPYTPDCYKDDDTLHVAMRGSLTTGESSSYTPALEDCEYRTVYGTVAFKGAHGQDHPDVHVILSDRSGYCANCGTFRDDGVQYRSIYDCGFFKPCWKANICVTIPAAAQQDGTGRNNFTLTVENSGPMTATDVYVQFDYVEAWVHPC